jgi:uncharacterized membrane protein
MTKLIRILRTTILGGVLFLVPFVVLIIIIGKAHKIIRTVLAPLADRIPVESVVGLETPKILAAMVFLSSVALAHGVDPNIGEMQADSVDWGQTLIID